LPCSPKFGGLRHALVVALALLCLPVHAAVTDCEVNGKSVSPYNGATTAGLSGIMRCVDRQTRQVVSEQELQNGKTMGVQKYYEKGRLQREFSTNEKGNREGIARTFGPDGLVLTEEQLINSERQGLQKRYYPGGALQALSFHEAKPAGSRSQELASIELTTQGQISELRCAQRPVLRFERIDDRQLCGFAGLSKVDLYSAERKTGRLELLQGKRLLSETLWDNGTVRSLAVSREGRYNEKFFNRSGNLMREADYALQEETRRKEIEQQFHESGAKTSEKRWSQGQLTHEFSWYLNGQPRTTDEFKGEQQLSKRFHDNGLLAFEGSFLRERYNQKRIGQHRHFDDKGRVSLEQTFDAQGKITRERRLDETGKVINDDEVFEDGSRRAFSK
jgi:antitoxin component YwqK of YwqJK toxin-antitoxin module